MTIKRYNITLEEELVKVAKEKTSNFSGYIQRLIEKDLGVKVENETIIVEDGRNE